MVRRDARDPVAHRLLATALEGRAVPGDAPALARAVGEYETALKGNPGDEVATERLAQLYQGRMNDPARAERVLEDLARARPKRPHRGWPLSLLRPPREGRPGRPS
ncbi:MAG: hypothetical protein WKF75_03905 [Singulisphaera sp.]